MSFKKYGLGSIYDDNVRIESLDLDKVEIAGCLSVPSLRRSSFLFVSSTIAWLEITEEEARKKFTNLRMHYGLKINEVYAGREKLLFDSRLIIPEPIGNLHHLSGYFEVLKRGTIGKGDDGRGAGYKPDTARSIFNGKRISECCVTPEPVNLPELPSVLRALSDLHDAINAGRKRALFPAIISADLRHWFHEIPISVALSRYFGIQFANGSTYRWATLPMGFSHSCRFAQCLAWGIVLGEWKRGPRPYFAHVAAEMKESHHPPGWVEMRNNIGQVVGIVFIWIDNVVAVCYDDIIAKDFVTHLRDGAEATGCVWKEVVVTHAADMACNKATDNSACFLGVQLGCTLPKSTRDGLVEPSRLQWRHVPEKLTRWKTARDEALHSVTRRRIARCVGLLVWDCYMGCRPLCDIDVVLQIASDNSTGMKNYKDWDGTSCITEQQTATLLNRVECVYNTNRWSGVAIMDRNAPVAFAASDASDRFGGQITFNDIGDIIDSKTLTWSAEFSKTHIFLKELLAACLTVENILKTQPRCKVIFLACDNTATVHVLQKMWSSNAHALKIVKRLVEKLTTSEVRLEMVAVRGVDNVADDPSRRALISKEKQQATWLQIQRVRSGMCKVKPIVTRCPAREGLRHAEEGRLSFLEDVAFAASSPSDVEALPETNPGVNFSDAEMSLLVVY